MNEERIKFLLEAINAICPRCRKGERLSGGHFLGWDGTLPSECRAAPLHHLLQKGVTKEQWIRHMNSKDMFTGDSST